MVMARARNLKNLALARRPKKSCACPLSSVYNDSFEVELPGESPFYFMLLHFEYELENKKAPQT